MYGSADEAAQSAERQKAKIRVLKDQRPCIAVLVVQDKQKNDHVIWASDTQHQRPSADWDWTVQMDQSDLNPMLAGQGLVRIDIWAYEEDGLDASRGKGKQKAADQPAAELNATNQGSWQLVLQHNIDLESLINLGTDVRL